MTSAGASWVGRSSGTGRRAPLRALIGLAALIVAAVAGCAAPAPAAPPSPPPAPATTAAGPATGTLVMIIRHGEKPDGSAAGIDADGKPDDSSLTTVGWARARALVGLFDPAGGPARAGLARPAAIYAAGVTDDGEGKRTRETVAPLAAKLGIPVNTDYGKGEEEELVAHVLTQPGPTLISWQHGEIPDIAEAFGSVTPTPPGEWPDDRFDVVWTFTRTATGWQFAQLPERVLPQDPDTIIEN